MPGGRPGKKKVTEMDLVAFQKKGGLTVTVQCTAVRTQSNLVIGTSWCLVEYLVEYLVELCGAATFNVGRASKVAQHAFQQPAQSVDTTQFE